MVDITEKQSSIVFIFEDPTNLHLPPEERQSTEPMDAALAKVLAAQAVIEESGAELSENQRVAIFKRVVRGIELFVNSTLANTYLVRVDIQHEGHKVVLEQPM